MSVNVQCEDEVCQCSVRGRGVSDFSVRARCVIECVQFEG